jgi:small GTP-binding protein
MVLKHFRRLHRKLSSLINSIFKRKKDVKLGLYGPVNAGKTSLANKICLDWLGEELGKVSVIPHETREIQMKEHVEMEQDGKRLVFNLVDTPGIATKIDFEDFVRYKLSKKNAKKRAKEATKGVIESIKWLDKMDLVLVVMDSTKDPLNQVNITILGNLEARGTPVLIVANKTDLKKSNVTKIRNAFPQYKVIGISAKDGYNIKEFYNHLFEMM